MNVVVIAAHGCPAGFLGPYGNEWVATPHLDRLAAEGVTFDRHYATRPDPLEARKQWWGPGGFGRRCVLIRASRPSFDAPSHYYARFAEVFDARPDPAGDSPFAPLLDRWPTALDRLAGRDDGLLWLETDRLLPPWDAPQHVFDLYCEDLTEDAAPDADADPLVPWLHPPVGGFDRADPAAWELLHRTFATAVSAFDADLGRLFDALRDRGLDRTATWAFTSDFGYPLGEHGVVGPARPWLHEEFVHLPLIVRRPNGEDAGRRVWDFTTPEQLWGLLAPPARAGETERGVVSVSEIDGHREAALRTDTHAFLLPLAVPDDEPRPPQLYEKPDDRWEVNDVRQPNLALADELEAELRRRLGPDGS